MTNGEIYGIKEFRTSECWDFDSEANGGGGNFNYDITLMILDRPIPGAKKGVHYLDTWNANKMGTVVGKKFTIAGWGMSGEIREDRSTDHLNEDVIFHRGYNKFTKLSGNVL